LAFSRRTARELALRVLFQLDVGKQPMSEVLDEVMNHALLAVNNPVDQVIRDARVALQEAVLREAPSGATSSGRRIRNALRMTALEFKGLEKRLEKRTIESFGRARSYLEEEAYGDAMEEVAVTEEFLAGVIVRYESEKNALERTFAELEPVLALIPVVYSRHAPGVRNTARLLSKLVHGVMGRTKALDKEIAEVSAGWSVDRQPAVDRNILRLAAFELLHMPDSNVGVAINEAIELAKKYSTDESARFINGALAALAAKQVEAIDTNLVRC
jgi:transcription antitermination factor NusB